MNVWNMHARTQDELPRTNNHIEGWNRRFSGNCDCLHPCTQTYVNLKSSSYPARRQDKLRYLRAIAYNLSF